MRKRHFPMMNILPSGFFLILDMSATTPENFSLLSRSAGFLLFLPGQYLHYCPILDSGVGLLGSVLKHESFGGKRKPIMTQRGECDAPG